MPKQVIDHKASLGTYINWLQLTNRLTDEEATTLRLLVDEQVQAEYILSQQGC